MHDPAEITHLCSNFIFFHILSDIYPASKSVLVHEPFVPPTSCLTFIKFPLNSRLSVRQREIKLKKENQNNSTKHILSENRLCLV